MDMLWPSTVNLLCPADTVIASNSVLSKENERRRRDGGGILRAKSPHVQVDSRIPKSNSTGIYACHLRCAIPETAVIVDGVIKKWMTTQWTEKESRPAIIERKEGQCIVLENCFGIY